ncbi:MAG: ubiquinol-cytochrome c reductase iron-sulfur subunit [Gemmatimonadota bacterium]|nr:MAG: ubiquinol-cytochrome c reductase iron-sulfur subunit [Gemmatimonadota bacterium]
MSKSRKRSSRTRGRAKRQPAEPAREVPAVEPEAPESQGSRRSFLGKLWIGIAGLAVVELVWIVVDFLRPRAAAQESDSNILVAGPVERFEPSSVTAFQEGRIYLSRLEDGGFLALSRSCTHLGCTVPWNDDESRFVCPCHASAYDEKGVVLNPPAPRPLDFYAVRIENGIVKVDLSKPLKRRSFNAAQVTYA